MHHRLLLGSTALVGAGMLFANAASAQEAGFEVILGGFTEFQVRAATHDTLANQRRNQNYGFFMDNEIIVRAQGITDSGIRYGSKIEIEVGGGFDAGTGGSGISIDEAGLFFSGNFGRVELGRDDGAEDVMTVGARTAQAGTGGVDGDTANLGNVTYGYMGDAIKATYFTPRIAGFQLGASWTPDGNDNNGGVGNSTPIAGANNRRNALTGGLNWVGVLGPVDLTVSATGLWADVKGSNLQQDALGQRDEQKAFGIGGLLGFGGLSFGVSFDSFKGPDEDDKGTILAFGLAYGFGPANVSVGFEQDWNDNRSNETIFVVSGDLGLLPGVTLKGDVSYNTEDPNKDIAADGTSSSGSTLAGVMTIQLDY